MGSSRPFSMVIKSIKDGVSAIIIKMIEIHHKRAQIELMQRKVLTSFEVAKLNF